MGFGFIFFGMKLMVGITQPLGNSALLQEIFVFLETRPLVLLFISIVFTIFVQNSAATIGLAIALSFSGLINLQFAIPIVLGANVGTCSGSILASLGSNTAGKRLALTHLILKILGASVAFALMKPFTSSVIWISQLFYQNVHTSGQIALAHLLFNLYIVILFLPFIKPAAWAVQKLIPEPREQEDKKFGPRYLDPKSLEVPSLAFANVRREMLRMMDLSMEMFRDCLVVFDKSDRVLLEEIQNQDDQVDLLNREIKFYLAKLSLENLSPEQAEMELRLIEMTSILEEIGDVINKNVMDLANKKINAGLKFSVEGWKEIEDFHSRILENFQIASGALASEDETLARKLLRHNEQLAAIERDYRQGHLNRLHQGLKETLETSSIHLDLLSNLYRINHLLAKLIRKANLKV
jgi:phosphate:Na+ symporter